MTSQHHLPYLTGLSPTKLQDALVGRDNNLNLIRMIAAAAVLVSHAFPIALGTGALEPLMAATGQTLGHYAVAVFFGISGLLIARSFDQRKSIIHFTASRVLRLYPALVLVLFLTVFAGAFLTQLSLPAYLSAHATWSYLPANLSLAFLQYHLPGVFLDNPYGQPINGSLWTLVYEVICYGGVALAGCIGILRSRILSLVGLAVIVALHLLFTGPILIGWDMSEGLLNRLYSLALLALPFALGTAAYVWRNTVILSPWIALAFWAVALLAMGTAVMASLILVATVYTSLWFGLAVKSPLLIYNRLGDYSYGIYIYAFPMQQLAMHIRPDTSPLENMLLAALPTIVLAIVSWELIERRALGFARPLADQIVNRLGMDVVR